MRIKIKDKKISVIIIFLLAFFLRFYQLGNVPPSLNWDENSNAYNAYSIIKTARDEYGNFLPLYNQSFDDYKPPLYMYLNVLTVSIFGLTPFAARLPSAFLGTITVLIFYYLAKFIFKDQKIVNRETVSQLSMLMLAISPWHIHFSKVGFEANIGLFTAVASITLLLYSIKKPKLLYLSAIMIGLSAYSYHSVRIYLPLLLILTVIFIRKDLLRLSRKTLILSLVITILLISPILLLTPLSSIAQRYKTTTSELRREEVEKSIKYIQQDKTNNFSSLIHNRRIFEIQTLLDNYLWHFDMNFLFTKGDDNFRHHIENQGMFYLWQLPLFIFGIYFLIKKRSPAFIYILLWLIIAPIAAAPAKPAPHAIRSFAMVIPMSLITSISLSLIIERYSKLLIFKFLTIIFAFTITISLISYLHNYYVHYARDKSSFWQYGYNLAAQETEKYKNQYEKIRVDGEIEQGYIFWLFTSKYDPKTYQTSGSREKFGKYIFDSSYSNDAKELFVTTAHTFPKEFELVTSIKDPKGAEIIKIGHAKEK